MRTDGSPKLPSPLGLTHECSISGQSSWEAGPGSGLQATVYGVAGPAMAATRIWWFGSALSAWMSATNLATGIRPLEGVSFDTQLDSASVGPAAGPAASGGGMIGGC